MSAHLWRDVPEAKELLGDLFTERNAPPSLLEKELAALAEEDRFTPRQLIAIQLLGRGMTKVQVARKVKVSEAVIYVWARKPDFRRAVNYVAIAQGEEQGRKLVEASNIAIDFLIQLAASESRNVRIRLEACLNILKEAKSFGNTFLDAEIQDLRDSLEFGTEAIQEQNKEEG